MLTGYTFSSSYNEVVNNALVPVLSEYVETDAFRNSVASWPFSLAPIGWNLPNICPTMPFRPTFS